LGSSGLSLEELQQLAARQQREIELKEQQLADKEEQLRAMKQQTRQKIKSSYIDQLEAQIQEQDKKMRHLRELQDEIENYRLSNSAIDAELQSMEVHFNSKEQELAMAAAKVEGLSQQLNEQREKWNKGTNQNQKSKEEKELDRLRQELMTRNELNHQQSIQLQAQKQLLAEKHKELFNLDSQIEQLTGELRQKKSAHGVLSSHPPSPPYTNANMAHSTSDNYHDNDNGLWENGESFDWSEFASAEDKYDEQVYSNYNDSDVNEHRANTRQGNSRHLETLVEVDETSTCSKASSVEGSNSSQGDSPRHGVRSRVSKLASFFEAEVAASMDQKPTTRGVIDRSMNDPRDLSVLSLESRSMTKGVEAVSPRTQQDRDGGFYSRPAGSSPLSSPSSLSSLSSFSSNSSTSKYAVKHDEVRGNAAETALKVRELKTEGMETFAVPTFQEKPRTLYEAKVFEDTKNVQRLDSSNVRENVPSDSVDSPFGNVKTSLQQLKTVAMSLNEPGSSVARRNISRDLDDSPGQILQGTDGTLGNHVDGPPDSNRTANNTIKPSGTSFTRKQDSPKNVAANSYPKKSSVSMVFASPTVRDILAEAGNEQESKSQTGENEKSARENNTHSNRYSDSSDQRTDLLRDQTQHEKVPDPGSEELSDSSKTASQGAMSKVRITLVSCGKRPASLSREEPVLKSERGKEGDITAKEATVPRSPNSNRGSFESWDELKPRDGKRTAKVRPVDSFNAKKVPAIFESTGAKNVNDEVKTQQDDVLTSHERKTAPTSIGDDKLDSSSFLQHGDHVSRNPNNSSAEKKKIRRVCLDPHAVLLDAAVEGELEQVKRVIRDVDDPSLANGDGITALHNAVCGNHEDVVRFLVEYGCDVNLPDSHGCPYSVSRPVLSQSPKPVLSKVRKARTQSGPYSVRPVLSKARTQTPLHCAAANNNFIIVQYLMENGACIFATTGLQRKTPGQCCEKSLPGYKECATFLEDIQTNFGVTNGGKVYALYAYSATEDDELSFSCGEELQVLRRGDSTEKEWWWAKNYSGQTGYIPSNLFGVRTNQVRGVGRG
ncbi:hypothetical protein QZH41_012462, partial [Actinostola sp. cb2023]